MLDLIWEDDDDDEVCDDDDDDDNDGDCDDDGGRVDWCKQSRERAAAGATSPNLNSAPPPESSSASSVATNFDELFSPPFHWHQTGVKMAVQGFRFWLNKVKCNGKGLQTKNMKQRRRTSDIQWLAFR